MELDFIIWGASAAVLVVLIVAHSWLHKLVTFKMDESTILKFFEDSSSNQFHTLEAISDSTKVATERVKNVCQKSPQIEQDSKELSWRLQTASNN